MVQLPALVRCTVLPATVQLPDAVKLTGNPELAVALTTKSGSPNVLSGNGPKAMVWDAGVIVKLPGTWEIPSLYGALYVTPLAGDMVAGPEQMIG